MSWNTDHFGPITGAKLDMIDAELEASQVVFVKELDEKELAEFNQSVPTIYRRQYVRRDRSRS